MKTIIRSLAVGALLLAVTPGFASVNAIPVASAGLEPAPVIVSQRTALSATELAKYRQREQAAKAKTAKQAAGEGMDKTTMIIVAVIAVVVIVAVASGGGGGGGGY